MSIFKALLFVAGMAALAGNVVATPGLTPKIALHVSALAPKDNQICSTWNPNAKGIPCSDYVVQGPVGQNLLVYMVVAQVDTPVVAGGGILGAAMGIEYNGSPGEGVDIYQWTQCGDLQFDNDWPNSGGGNVMTWVNCQNTRIVDDGIHTVVGAFGVYAYSADQLRVTPNRTTSG